MLNRVLILLAAAAVAIQAQTVVKGLGKSPSDYTSAWGRADRSGDGPFDTREQVWTVHRKSGLSGQDFEVHVLFRAERAVEERWVRRGSGLWEKDELWTVLDGKGEKFEMLHQGTGLVSPFNVLQSPNTVINFLPAKANILAQLQNTLQGPQVLFSSKEWAQNKSDLGIVAKQDVGRLASQAVQSRVRPTWGGKSLQALVAGMYDQGTNGNTHSYTTRTGRGSLALISRKGTRLELSIPEPSAPGDPNRILSGKDPALAALKASLRDGFRHFYTTANRTVPGLLGGDEWSADRVEGAFTDDVLQDLLALKRLPSEFPLLAWKDAASGEAWDLVITQDGYKLSIQWPAGTEPK
jgi:hypothetical protein